MKVLMFAIAVLGTTNLFAQSSTKGVAVSYPWAFNNGTDTSRKTAIDTAGEIAQKAGFAVVSQSLAIKAWDNTGFALPTPKKLPSLKQLRAFAKEAKADRVLYGTVSWHTRSIWVGTGPKTISTATVSVYAYDAKQNKVVYKSSSVSGRSDEKEDTLKVVGAVLVTPLVTAVSGGPATPREQRAVRIALARAYHDWVTPKKK